ncbi:MAG: hypothetical protein GC164_06365 [Phycisphaera sp.]|nr:hypothetical protein [Phycisphaera sp.]
MVDATVTGQTITSFYWKPLCGANIDGSANFNYALTDGSVARFKLASNNDMPVAMNPANGGGIGAGNDLFPKAWRK